MGDGVASRRALTGSKSSRNLRARAISLFAAMTVMIVGFGSGLASAADPLVGKTYSDAASWISNRNGTPVVATVSGSQLALDECIVTSWHRGGYLNSQGKNDRRNEYYLSLNCNNPVATPGHPGNSVVTPEGATAKKERETALRFKEDQSWCHKSERNLSYCQRICKKTGLCEI